jgi:acid stress-induced BolA-like protein IbaG/YrbA
VIRPEVAAIVRAVYDPVMPAVAQDASHALRIAARAGKMQ